MGKGDTVSRVGLAMGRRQMTCSGSVVEVVLAVKLFVDGIIDFWMKEPKNKGVL